MGSNAQFLSWCWAIMLTLSIIDITSLSQSEKDEILVKPSPKSGHGTGIDCCKTSFIPPMFLNFPGSTEFQYCMAKNEYGNNCQTSEPSPSPPTSSIYQPNDFFPSTQDGNDQPPSVQEPTNPVPTTSEQKIYTETCVMGDEPSCPLPVQPEMLEPRTSKYVPDEIITNNGTPTPAIPADVQRCRALDSQPIECRRTEGCIFICADRRCDAKRLYLIEQSPLTPSTTTENQNCSKNQCSQHCFDLHHCKAAGCEFQVTGGNCLGPGPMQCPDWIFEKDQCVRPNSVYSRGGQMCYTNTGNGECKVSETITAVNFGEEKVTDSRNINYHPHKEVDFEDPHNLLANIEQGTGTIENLLKQDEKLYESYVVGNHSEPGVCVKHKFIITRDGHYEIAVKVLEPTYTERGKRFWSIRVNDIFVAPELDIFYFPMKGNYSFDIIIRFQVEDGLKKLEFKGFSEIKAPIGEQIGDMTLSFCRGSYGNGDGNLVIPAFYIARLPGLNEPENCQSLNNDRCACVDSGCQINNIGKCEEGEDDCMKILGSKTECRRTNAWYALGSKLCRNEVEHGNCENMEVVWAVNMNGLSYADNRGIFYHGGDSVEDLIIDEGSIKMDLRISDDCPKVIGVSEKDAYNLFETVVTGDLDSKNVKGCISYPIPICRDGRYELSIKSVDHQSETTNMRRFNVKVNNVTVLAEIDLRKFGQRCEAIEFIILFDIDIFGRKLRIDGHPEVEIPQSDLELQLCYGECPRTPNKAFQMSAYSVVRLGELHNSIGSKGKCEEQTDVCNCKHNQCEFDTNMGICSERKMNCGLCDFTPDECRRAGAWYASSGMLCQNSVDKGNCQIDKTIFGLNAGGKEQADSKGIPHKSYTSVLPAIRDPGVQKKSTKSQLLDIHPADANLFSTYITGSIYKNGIRRNGTCHRYNIPMDRNGKFELTIKVGDFWNDAAGKKTLNFKLNGLRLVHELDIRAHTKSKSHVMEIIVNLKVTGGGEMLHLKGHPTSQIVDKRIPFEICYGDCVRSGLFKDDNWQIGAVSVIKFKDSIASRSYESDPGTNECTLHFDNPCQCRKAGCEFNVVSKECLLGKRGCEESEMNIRKSECRRKDAFYMNGGVICQNRKERGNCGFKDVLIGINFAEEGYADINGIEYLPYNEVYGHIPEGTSVGQSVPVIFGPGVDPVDEFLYKTYVYANPEKPNAKDCLSYNIRFQSDGEFEFSAKFLEFKYSEPGKRTFSIKINGVTIVKELDIKLLAGNKQNVLNLVVNFNVSDERRTLVLPGYPDSLITNGKVIVEFCNGMCEGVDRFWTLTAFSVVEFGIPSGPIGECRKYDQNVCDCVANSCQLRAATGECLPGIQICDNYYGVQGDCRRENAFYTDGGLICRNTEAIGDCKPLKTSYGVNLNGLSYESSDNIKYIAEDDVTNIMTNMIHDPFKIKNKYVLNCSSIVGAANEDSTKLLKLVTGSVPKKVSSRRCLSYTIPFCEDGRYEILIKTLDQSWSKNRTRRMNVIFHKYSVYNEIDLFQLAGQRCKLVELAILFEVDDMAKLIRIQGFPNSKLKESKTTLDLCYSECTELGDNFHASGISLVRLGDPVGGPKDPCGEHHGESCDCVRAECDYQSGRQLCSKRRPSCSTCDLSPTDSEDPCRRDRAYYIDGIGICKNTIERGNCSFGKVIKAVNMNGPALTSSTGLEYESFKSAKPDRVSINLKKGADKLDDNDNFVEDADKALYETFVHSDDIVTPCMAYKIPIKEDGSYELAIKTWDNSNTETGKRTMKIRFNDIDIVEDLDLVLIAGFGKAVDIIVNFKVSHGDQLEIEGYDASEIKGGIVSFEICQGDCQPNLGWLLGAFSVLKFGDVEEPFNIDEELGCGTSDKGLPMYRKPCHLYSQNICGCKTNERCQYNHVNGKCYRGAKDCKQCEITPISTKCRLYYSFYFDAGVACRTDAKRGLCTYTKVIIAVTFGGAYLTDSTGIKYEPFHIRKPDFLPEGVGNATGMLTDSLIRSPLDKKLFESFAFGNSLTPNSTECLRYKFNITSDGTFELAVKIFDFANRWEEERGFDIKFNGVAIARELDVIKLAPSRSRAINLVVNFKVNPERTLLLLPGFKPTQIPKSGEISLEFCNGSCLKSKIWIVSAFSVKKFKIY